MKKIILFSFILLLVSWCWKQWNIKWEDKKIIIKKVMPSWKISLELQKRIEANTVPGF